ncbi:ABC transporter ATP-binding protein [Martelella sp. AD-3]|uniref:ABC transporter ATP-binding protein n=1 Tax=Martelella sp. AD-3 TaxID=686597 RepID=UPI000465D30A|nr:ABC transporter ATP-binding protein [Martelella sp. AD-3]AMM85750.1 Fe3+/spermidine/putrescine ABC transporter ATP-binding protein [Martelella sp. AD-3]
MSDIHLDQIRKSYGHVEVLHGIDLKLASGEFVSLLGASGCGKTTLLRTVAGLEAASAGRVVIDHQDVTNLPPERRDIAMMFQSYALLPHLSVYENVRFPLRMRRIGTRAEQDQRVKDALETVQLPHLSDRFPRQLSGGQQQRVALARAIVSNPKVLLLDEPLSNLDARLREDMQVELIEIHRRLGLTTLFVTHDQEEALSLSDRVVLLNAGKVEQEGAPEAIYAEPATEFVSGFIGSANILPATVEAGYAVLEDGQRLALPASDRPDGPVSVALRQEDLGVAADGGGLKARVRTRVYLGGRNRYVLSLAGQTIRMLTANEIVLKPGEDVMLSIALDRIRVLDRRNT